MNHHKNANGESLFIFEWQGGGGNRVYAMSRDEAIKKVFNDRRHVDFFIDYIQKKKGYIFDEIWYQ